MRGEELINVAQAASHGDVRHVRNTRTRKKGVVVAMDDEAIKVRVNNEIEIWDVADCEEQGILATRCLNEGIAESSAT